MPKKFRIEKRPPSATVRMKKIRQSVVQNVNSVLDEHLRLRRLIVATWRSHAPNFMKSIKSSRKFRLEIFYEIEKHTKSRGKKGRPNASKYSVYRMLNDGTSVRFARMSPDWASKSAVKIIGAYAGSGNAFPSSKPYEGIDARGWEKPLNGSDDGLINPLLEDKMTKAIKQGYRDGFNSVQG